MNILNLTQTEYVYYVANDITSIYVQGKPQACTPSLFRQTPKLSY
jgi:hypothetical protein